MSKILISLFQLPQASDSLPKQRSIKHYFRVQKLCFTAIGIDPTSLNSTIFNHLLSWIPMLSTLTITVPIYLLAIDYTDDLDKMANILAPTWQALLALAKFTLFMWNKKKIVEMIRNVWLSNLNARDEELKILLDENYYEKRISLLYYCSALISSILLFTSPFMAAGFYAWKGAGYWESLELPYKALYHWDPKSSVLSYIVNLLWNVAGIYFIFNCSLGVDTLFCWFMRNISAEFRILNFRFTEAGRKSSNGQVRQTDKEFVRSISEVVKYHRHVLTLAENFNDVYKQLVFVKFLVSCVQIACLTFQFSRGGAIIVQVFNVSFMLTVTVQLMLYCHGGQTLTDLSLSVGSVIYDSFPWADLSVKSQKLLLLPIVRSTKSCEVSGIFFIANFSLFLWVYRAAGSFLTMMVSMEEAKK